MEEEDGMAYWPIIPVMCILNFLMINSDITDLSGYNKASKGYSYFKQGWLGKIPYHVIESEHCFLRADCRPSERLRDPPHKLWLYVMQKSGNTLRAHCTCMAGMGSTCNRIAAALFRVEAVMRLGLINPACTEKTCEWLPNSKNVNPLKIKDRPKPARLL